MTRDDQVEELLERCFQAEDNLAEIRATLKISIEGGVGNQMTGDEALRMLAAMFFKDLEPFDIDQRNSEEKT